MELTEFKVLSFDCYGTLIDWETGLFTAYQPLIAKLATPLSQDEVLAIHARYEAQQEEETPTLPYSQLLSKVYARVAKDWNINTTAEEDLQFGNSIPTWPAFADSAASLQYLKKYYKLVILSNIDRKNFQGSNKLLQVNFDHIFTAQDIGSYKPSLNNFEYMLAKLAEEGIEKQQILHTAESLFHDHIPANKIGLASAWIHRRHSQSGYGATHPPAIMPHYDFKFNSMADMVRMHRDLYDGKKI